MPQEDTSQVWLLSWNLTSDDFLKTWMFTSKNVYFPGKCRSATKRHTPKTCYTEMDTLVNMYATQFSSYVKFESRRHYSGRMYYLYSYTRKKCLNLVYKWFLKDILQAWRFNLQTCYTWIRHQAKGHERRNIVLYCKKNLGKKMWWFPGKKCVIIL